MTKIEKIRMKRLAEIESEFLPLLLSCLRQCAQGRWGLFGQNDHLDPEKRYWKWPEADRLKELANEIKSILLESGQENETCNRFLHLCTMIGSNLPGEPKLAETFLAELDESYANSLTR